ncbi:MAG TPA: DUF1127 domain-containing protein [Stellaceae bacterium]|jgi:uncharacterized protein YjiS (DUF1127 family)|nr:DUF1127 domain-containing protein [Stellaceae bacterium]
MTTHTLWHPAHLRRDAIRAPVALDRLTGAFKHAIDTVRTWRGRSRDRAELSALSDRMLSDIGITRADAIFLSNKPFWKE